MKNNKTLLFGLASALMAGNAFAQAPDADHQAPPPPPVMALFDSDHDGLISAEEIESASAALQTIDANGDGEITPDEARPPGPPLGHRPPAVIAALDQDRDGQLSADELDQSKESLLTLDQNGDGELSPDELHPQGPPPQADAQGSQQNPPADQANGKPHPQPDPDQQEKK